MTQPADGAPAEVAAPQSPAEEEEKPRVYASIEEMFEEIRDRAGLDSFKDVKQTRRAVVLDPDGKPWTFDLNKDSPLDAKSIVIGVFYDTDSLRVFTFPKEKGEIKCYSFPPSRVCFTLDVMTDIEMFIDEMAGEYAALASDLDDDDDEAETPETNNATVAPS
jgi:hypothetical protein